MIDSIDGSGTEEDPYKIENIEHLQAINRDLSAYYLLVSDIEAGHTEEWNNHKGFNPIGTVLSPFNGTFDGNNYQIKNLHINRPGENSVGIFSANTGRIRNVGITSGTTEGNCHTGGIVGRNWGEIESSYLKKDISGSSFTGGFIGHNSGEVKSSYTKGKILGDNYVGSLVGYSSGQINSSYSTGDVSGDSWSGGVAGCIDKEGEVNGSFVFNNLDRYDESRNYDLMVSRGNWKISYIVDTNTLYLETGNEEYYRHSVSSVQVQNFVNGFNKCVVKANDNFRSSVVASR